METVRNLPVVKEGDIIKVQYDNSNKVLDFVVDHGRIYFGKTLFMTSPKKITGKKIGEKFTIRKDKVKIIAINGK